MNTTLILHWWWGTSEENWLPWIKKELEFKADDLYIPNLPNTKDPVLDEQLEYLYVYANGFNDAWNIVWHSLWCQLALHFIMNHNLKNIDVTLVAPSYPNIAEEWWEELFGSRFDILKKYYDREIDFEKFNKLWNRVTVFLSDNDPYINMENAKKYYWNIENVNFIEFKNKWHFNQGAWVLELEEVLGFIK